MVRDASLYECNHLTSSNHVVRVQSLSYFWHCWDVCNNIMQHLPCMMRVTVRSSRESPSLQKCYNPLRSSSHNLEIEICRHWGPTIPSQERLCLVCRALEDEKHSSWFRSSSISLEMAETLQLLNVLIPGKIINMKCLYHNPEKECWSLFVMTRINDIFSDFSLWIYIYTQLS